ncbi:hypothetical protein ACFXEL_24810 [Streptomyces sp. NPDC059382]|uniref:hypothetical protein n=1 Tax=Streptomyces sp. NPDC059382 TaxID=3346816 RepID=UPI0036D07F00
MGSVEFYEIAAEDNASKAFDAARGKAVAAHGHLGYTGSLAEKDLYVAFDEPRRSEADAYARADKLMDANDPRIDDKWGPAGALPITTSDGKDGWMFFGWASY